MSTLYQDLRYFWRDPDLRLFLIVTTPLFLFARIFADVYCFVEKFKLILRCP